MFVFLFNEVHLVPINPIDVRIQSIIVLCASIKVTVYRYAKLAYYPFFELQRLFSGLNLFVRFQQFSVFILFISLTIQV